MYQQIDYQIDPEQIKQLGDVKKEHGGLFDLYEGKLVGYKNPNSKDVPERGTAPIAVAIKTLSVKDEGRRNSLKQAILKEAKIWAQIGGNHKVVLFYGYSFADQAVSLVRPWYKEGNLVQYVSSHKMSTYNEPQTMRLILEASQALAYLHARDPVIVHGNVKAANFLISDEGHAVLCDFGFQRLEASWSEEAPGSKPLHRSTRWRAPELLKGGGESTSGDVWAFGCFVYEVTSLNQPYPDLENDQQVFEAVVNKKRTPKMRHASDKYFHNTIRPCWSYTVEGRPDMSTLTEHIAKISDCDKTERAKPMMGWLHNLVSRLIYGSNPNTKKERKQSGSPDTTDPPVVPQDNEPPASDKTLGLADPSIPNIQPSEIILSSGIMSDSPRASNDGEAKNTYPADGPIGVVPETQPQSQDSGELKLEEFVFTESSDSYSTPVSYAEGPETHGALNKSPQGHSELSVGVSTDRGIRRTMEDVFAYNVDFDDIPGQGLFGVFDGHSGKHSSEFLGANFHRILRQEVANIGNQTVPQVLTNTYHIADAEITRLSDTGVTESGSTAAVAFIRLEDSNGKQAKAVPRVTDNSSSEKVTPPRRVLYASNVGDARVVLMRKGKAYRLTYDHKASDTLEVQRILKAGGFVLNHRVNGVLAVTRSLGDSAVKEYVVGTPYTTETDLVEGDEWLIIASDGLWDVVEDQAAVDLIKDCETGQAASDSLVRHALKNYSNDNITVIVVKLSPSINTTQGSLKGWLSEKLNKSDRANKGSTK